MWIIIQKVDILRNVLLVPRSKELLYSNNRGISFIYNIVMSTMNIFHATPDED